MASGFDRNAIHNLQLHVIPQLPDHIKPIAIVPLGYTTFKAPAKSRKPLSEIVHWEKFTSL